MQSYWDLLAAFDTLDHGIFLDKLKVYGFDKNSMEWFKSYLKDRRQFVQIGQERSTMISLKYGSPQGAILSPLIFIIFIGDLELWVSSAIIKAYADDISSYVSDKELGAALKKLESDADKIVRFMSSNYLVVNPSKTGFLIIRSSKHSTTEHQTIQVGGKKLGKNNQKNCWASNYLKTCPGMIT